VLVGLIAKVITGAARRRREALSAERAPASGTASSPTPAGSGPEDSVPATSRERGASTG
jgi:hypothetical protein